MLDGGPLIALCRVAVAGGIGLLLGLEREMSHKPAGLRTQVLVTVGATLFILSSVSLGADAAGKVAANIVTGLGFLGAGVIFRDGGTVRGLTTAALIWVNGALGVAAAFGDYILAVGGAIAAVLVLRMFGYVEGRMATKCRVARYHVTARDSPELMRSVQEALGHAHFQEGPLSFSRKDGVLSMRFAFCNPPPRHEEFMAALRGFPGVIDLEVI